MPGVIARIRSKFYFDRYSLVQFFRQTATLVKAGFGIMRALQTCARQTSEPRLVKTIDSMISLIDRGFSYSEAMSRNSDIFSPFQVSMVKAAEASGKLPEILESLAEYEEKETELRFKMKSATTYPVFVFLFSIFCIILLMKFLTPLLDTITDVLKGDIPIPTMILMKIAHAVSHPLFYVGLLLFLIALRLIYKYYSGVLKGKLTIDTMLFKIPLFGELYKKVILIRSCRVMYSLLDSGVPAALTMELMGEVADNFYFKDRIMGEMVYRVQEGSSIHTAAGESGFFPRLMVSMVAIGEESGSLPTIMKKLADIYEFDVEIAMSNFYATLEPMLILAMGLFTFMILLAAFLPIYQIIGNLTR